jgi:O-antigen/teichoic acid export membrane protein
LGTVLQAAALGDNDAATGRAIYRDAMLFNLALVGAAACPLAIGSPWILGLFGPEFRDGWPTLVVCLATALCLSVVKPAQQTLNATGRTWTSFGIHVGFAAFYIISSVLLAPFGALGMASARFAAYALHAVCLSTAARMLYPLDGSLKTSTCGPFSPADAGDGTGMRAA